MDLSLLVPHLLFIMYFCVCSVRLLQSSQILFTTSPCSFKICFLSRDFFKTVELIFVKIYVFCVVLEILFEMDFIPAGIYLFKLNNENNRTKCEICSKLTIKTPQRCHWCRSVAFISNCEQISHIVLVFPLTLNR